MAVMIETNPRVSIDGIDMTVYVIMDVAIHKELLKPAELRFSMRKRPLLRGEEDIRFDVAERIIGRTVKLEIQTSRRDETMREQSETLSFEGIVFAAQMQRQRVGAATYINVTAYSPDYLLADNQHCCSFENRTLSDIINESVSPYNDIIQTELSPTMGKEIPYVVQYNETTYQFISRLAQRYGEFLYYENGKMHFGQLPSAEVKELYPDTDLLGVQYDLAVEHTRFSHAAHDYLKYENGIVDGCGAASDETGYLPDAVCGRADEIYKKSTLQTYHSATLEDSSFDQLELSSRVQAWGDKSRYLTCRIRTNRADLLMGDCLILKECADEGGHTGRDSIIEHDQEFVVIGIDYHATADGHFENEVTAIPAGVPYAPYMGCDIYPQCESQRAKVVDNDDPEQLGRIRVQFLWQELADTECYTPWLRITQPHGGDDKGFYFIPEIGEEVMVAFEHGNAEKPYVVGTLYHGKQHPGNQWPDSNNNVKAIRTRNGHTVEIHDEGPGGYIRIYDYQKENYILTYSTDEKLIKLESTGNIELYAQNDIIMHAGHDINASADNDIFIAASHDMQRTADNDIREHAGNDRNTNIDHNDSLDVSENQFIQIGDNKDEQVENKLQVTADNIRVEANDQLLEYSKTHHLKADNEMALNASSKIDIKAGIVKVN